MADHAEAPLAEKMLDASLRQIPLLRNHWYVAALSEEVTRQPLRRTILEHDIVFFRQQDGQPVALQNRCAHRSYPLHLGELKGDRIVCGYHGFEFAPDGRCALVPSMEREQPHIRIHRYPVKEVGPFIWIWTGDPDQPDHSRLVEQPWFTGPEWSYTCGYLPYAGGYLGMHENLMDLGHFPFLHTFAKGHTALAKLRPEREILSDRVRSHLVMPNFPVSPLARQVMQFEGAVTEDSDAIVQTPAMYWAKVTWIDSSSPPKTMVRYIIHCMTPETSKSTHYYWAISHNAPVRSPEMNEEFRQVATQAFQEDTTALEQIETLMERDRRLGFREMLVPADVGGVQVMRLFARWAAEEA